MTSDFTAYTNALLSFYKAVADWKFASITNDSDNTQLIKNLKEKAQILKTELENLPPSMVRPLLVQHIEKVIAL